MDATVSVEATYVSHADQFSEHVHVAADRVVTRAAQRGSFISKVLAPKRTLKLASMIRTGVYGPGVGAWSVGPLKYALAQEKGARRHVIESHEGPGGVLANKADGFYSAHAVMHPGNPGIHFLLRAYEQVKLELLPDLKRELGG